MPFKKSFKILLHKSNNSIISINSNQKTTLDVLDQFFQKNSSITLLNNHCNSLDMYFDIDNNDNIYGLVNNKSGTVYYYNITNDLCVSNSIITYNQNLYTIKSLYIKKINNTLHIFFYLFDKTIKNKCSLMHYYMQNSKWFKNTISLINYKILSNFIVITQENIINIFYFNVIQDSSNLFVSSFDMNTGIWNIPKQITNTNNHKVYLSVIMDKNSVFHITFSENINSKYNCFYIKMIFNNNDINLLKYISINSGPVSSFPTIIEHDNILNLQWVEYNKLFYCTSPDLGDSWTKPKLLHFSVNYDFIRCLYRSNNSKLKINNNQMFIQEPLTNFSDILLLAKKHI